MIGGLVLKVTNHFAFALECVEKDEILELEAAMAALDDVEEAFDEEGMDDLFVLQATATETDEAPETGETQQAGPETDDESDVESSDAASGSDEEEGGIRGYPGYKGDGVSLASSYWRKERHDRNEQLAYIDERFERLAFEYDEDQIGELDDEEENLAGPSGIDKFDHVLDEFIEKHVRPLPLVLGRPQDITCIS